METVKSDYNKELITFIMITWSASHCSFHWSLLFLTFSLRYVKSKTISVSNISDIKLGGLNLSWHGLDQDSQSRQFKTIVSMCWENMDTSKTLSQHVEKVLTAKKSKSLLSRYPKVSIFNKVLIETPDLDSSKPCFDMWQKPQHFQKPCLNGSRYP